MESGLDMGNWKRLREKGQLKVGVLEMKSVEVLIGSDERKRSKVKTIDSLPRQTWWCHQGEPSTRILSHDE